MIGQTISHYKILEKLGEGGMGVVYKAEDLMLHRMVALKFPSDPMVHDKGISDRLMNEARMAASLIHQNVTVVHNVGEYEGKPYIVMEYVDGLSLRHTIINQGKLAIDKAIVIAIQICEGLEAVHKKMVIHRDIKTENILLTNSDQVKIADCGLAARFVNAEKLEKKLGIVGTTAYMSPEQVRGEQLDQRSDIFSLGVVMYEMCSGRLPFEAKHQAALMYLITHSDPTPMQTYINNAPQLLINIINKALEKDRDKRYQNVHEILIDLRKLLQS